MLEESADGACWGGERKEDLDLLGNQLNYMTAAWTAGYVIGEVPSNMIMTRVRPSVWIPSLEVGVS